MDRVMVLCDIEETADDDTTNVVVHGDPDRTCYAVPADSIVAASASCGLLAVSRINIGLGLVSGDTVRVTLPTDVRREVSVPFDSIFFGGI
jgi:hypothetical protein